MKRVFFIFMTSLLSLSVGVAGNVKTVRLDFSKQQFSFAKDEVGAIEVASHGLVAGYDEDTSLPGLPLVAVNVGFPNGSLYGGVTETVTRQLIYDDVVVAANPVVQPTNYKGVVPAKTLPVYEMSVYPNKAVNYVGTSTIDGYTIFRFLVCPFEYDVQGKKLYLRNNVTLNISFEDSPMLLSLDNEGIGQNMREIVMSQIVNPDDFNEPEIMTSGLDIEIKPIESITSKYLIVTSENLVSSFQALANLKYLKGLDTEIVAVETIAGKYPNMDVPLAIKTYLKEQYENNRLKYVLLGGDNTIVPVRRCYVSVNKEKETTMPVDLYYACFDKCFSWDANGNGIYGEVSDSISMDPSIFVTRAPVRSSADVDAFTSKIIGYELYPLEKGWNNNMLISGATLFQSAEELNSDYSDVVFKGNSFYNNSVLPYWSGEKKSFYDTYTDFVGGANYDLTRSKLQYQLSQGYSFVEMITHGAYRYWGLEDRGAISNRSYSTNEAADLTNNNYSIITTSACNTNAFDLDGVDPCLSEAFVRNPNNGVIAYLGCSRYGWEVTTTDIGPSLQYDSQFYEKLFSDDITDKHFGEIVATAKSILTGFCYADSSPYRWLQFGINPIGDPEMPIYTTVPQVMSNVSVTYGLGKKSVVIDTGLDGCQIYFSSKDSNGKRIRLIKRNVRNATFQLDDVATICIMKQNYIPCFKTVTPSPTIPNAITNCSVDRSSNNVAISTQLAENVKNAEVAVSSVLGNSIIHKLSVESPTVIADLSGFPNGVHVVSLIVDGKVVDSKNIIK